MTEYVWRTHPDRPAGKSAAFDMTLMALSEVNPRAAAALRVLGPNSAGDPMIGLLGFMSPGDCIDLVKAADLAHRRLGSEGWREDGWTVEEVARYIAECGAWRNQRQHSWRDRIADAVTRYQIAIRDEAGS